MPFLEEEEAFLEGEGALFDGEGAFLEEEGAFFDGEGAFLEVDRAFLEGDGAFLEGDGAFLEGEGALVALDSLFLSLFLGAFDDFAGLGLRALATTASDLPVLVRLSGSCSTGCLTSLLEEFLGADLLRLYLPVSAFFSGSFFLVTEIAALSSLRSLLFLLLGFPLITLLKQSVRSRNASSFF